MMTLDILLPILGFLVGAMVGITGLGGGVLMTPALLFLGVPPTTAVGTDLLYAAISKAMGATLYARRGDVYSRTLIYLLAGGVPATLIGYYALLELKTTYGLAVVNSLTGFLLAVALLSISTLYLLQNVLRKSISAKDSEKRASRTRLLSIAVGFLTGLAVQLTSVGSGVLVTIFLLSVISRPGRIVGTGLAFGVVVTTLGGLLHFTLGHTDLFILLPLIAGATPGIVIGTLLNDRIPVRPFRLILIILMLVVSVVLLIQYSHTIFTNLL